MKENKPILFLINPPFSKNSNSNISKDFQQENFNNNHILLGHILFLYRIIQIKKKYNLSNVKICLISPLTFLTRESFDGFRKFLFKNCSFLYGFICNSYEFELDAIWTVGFSIFDLNSTVDKSLTYEIYNSDKLKTFYSSKKSEKFSTHLQTLNKTIKNKYGFIKKSLTRVSSAYKLSSVKIVCQTIDSKNLLGYYVSSSNNVQSSNFTTIYTAPPTHNLYFCITKENLESVCINFAIRKSIKKNFINTNDEYLFPKVKKDSEYQKFVTDCVVHSLFQYGSQQGSLRNVNSENVFNKFFFIPVEKVKELSLHYKNEKVLKDVVKHGKESFVLKYLSDKDISKESIEVYKCVIDLFYKSFPLREKADKIYQLNSYDAGWNQLAPLIKENFKEEYKNFLNVFRLLEKSIEENVYKYRFLK